MIASNLDVNDLHKAEGLDAVKAQFGAEAVERLFAVKIPLSAPTPKTAAATGYKAELDAFVAETNKDHASVLFNGKHRIMRENSKGKLEFLLRDDWLKLYDNTRIQVSESKFMNKMKAWCFHEESRTYRGGVFFAPGEELSADCYNTFKDFAVKPVMNDELLVGIFDHIKTVICRGSDPLNDYVIKWMAYCFQNPGKPVGTALVLRGDKGTGKGLLGHLLRALWGRYGLHISNSRYLVGNFNALLSDVAFVFADEAFFAGDKIAEGSLKGLITEPTIQIEWKGLDAVTQDNFLKIFMATNSDWCVPATRDERRYCVLDVSPHKAGDRDYFNALSASTHDKATQAAFLHYLLNVDLEGFHSGDVPETEGLRSQRFLSMDSIQKWLAESLHNGGFDTSSGYATWDSQVTVNELYKSYSAYCDLNKLDQYRRLSQCAVSLYLGKKLGFEKLKRVGSLDVRGFYLGSLDIAIARFESYERVVLDEIS